MSERIYTYSVSNPEADDAQIVYAVIDLSKIVAIKRVGGGNILIQTTGPKGMLVPSDEASFGALVAAWKEHVAPSLNS